MSFVGTGNYFAEGRKSKEQLITEFTERLSLLKRDELESFRFWLELEIKRLLKRRGTK